MAAQVTPSKQVRDVTVFASRVRRVLHIRGANNYPQLGCFLSREPQDDRLTRQTA